MAQRQISELQKKISKRAKELAWRDLSAEDRKKFKEQARGVLSNLRRRIPNEHDAGGGNIPPRQLEADGGKITALVLEKYPIAYVFTPKVGSTSIKHALYQLEHGRPWEKGTLRNGRPIYVHSWRGIDPRRPIERLEGYFRFCVVRDPIERLLSAYSNRVWRRSLPSLDSEAAVAKGLTQRPDLSFFIANLEAYRQHSRAIRRHTIPQIGCIGTDLSVYDRVFRLDELHLLPDVIERATGARIELEHHQRSSRPRNATLSPTEIGKLTEFYRKDYEVLAAFFQPPPTFSI
jgi:hypothetical protein